MRVRQKLLLKYIGVLFLLLSCLFCSPSNVAWADDDSETSGKQPKILVIVSGKVNDIVNDVFISELRTDLGRLGVSSVIKAAELSGNINSDNWSFVLAQVGEQQLSDFEAVVCLGTGAADFVMRVWRPDMSVPLLLLNCQSEQLQIMRRHVNVAGICAPDRFRPAVRIGSYLFPKAKTAIVITDDTPYGKSAGNRLKHERLSEISEITVIGLDQFSPDQILKKMRRDHSNCFVVVTGAAAFNDFKGESAREWRRQIAEIVKRPLITTEISSLYEPFTVAGYCVMPDRLAADAAPLLKRGMSHGFAAKNNTAEAKATYVADTKALTDYGISSVSLPWDTLSVNGEYEFPYALPAIVAAGVLLFVGVLWMLIQVVKRFQRQKALAAYQLLPLKIVAVNRNLQVIFSNVNSNSTILGDNSLSTELTQSGFKDMIMQVFEDGFPCSYNYLDKDGEQRRASFVYVEPGVFGCPAVAWFSSENASLMETSQKVKDTAEKVKIKQAEVREARFLLEEIVESVPVACCVKEVLSSSKEQVDKRFVCANKLFRSFHKLHVGLIQGKTDEDEMNQAWCRASAQADRKALNGSGGVWQERLPLPNNVEKLFVLESKLISSGDGRRFLLCTFQDQEESTADTFGYEEITIIRELLLGNFVRAFYIAEAVGHHNFVEVSQSFATLLRMSKKQFAGQNLQSLGQWGFTKVYSPEQMASEGNSANSLCDHSVWVLKSPDNHSTYIQLTEKLFSPAGAEYPFIVGIAVDITADYLLATSEATVTNTVLEAVHSNSSTGYMDDLFQVMHAQNGCDALISTEYDVATGMVRNFRCFTNGETPLFENSLISNGSFVTTELWELVKGHGVLAVSDVASSIVIGRGFARFMKSGIFAAVYDDKGKMTHLLGLLFNSSSCIFTELDKQLFSMTAKFTTLLQNRSFSSQEQNVLLQIKAVFASIPLMVALIDRQHRICCKSQAIEEFSSMHPVELRQVAQRTVGKALETGRKAMEQFGIDGKIYRFITAPIWDAQGQIEFLAQYCLDVTEQELLKQAQENDHLFCKRLFDSVGIAVSIINVKDNCRRSYSNASFRWLSSHNIQIDALSDAKLRLYKEVLEGHTEWADVTPLVLSNNQTLLVKHMLIPVGEMQDGFLLEVFVDETVQRRQLGIEILLSNIMRSLIKTDDIKEEVDLRIDAVASYLEADYGLTIIYDAEDNYKSVDNSVIKGRIKYAHNYKIHKKVAPLDFFEMPLRGSILDSEVENGQTLFVVPNLAASPRLASLCRCVDRQLLASSKSAVWMNVFAGEHLVYSFVLLWERLTYINSIDEDMLRTIADIINIFIFRQNEYDKLEQASCDAVEASKAEKYFISSISHEIRTPLNSVVGFANLLYTQPDLDAATRQEWLEHIFDSGTALKDIIDDVLDLSKIQAHQMNFAVSHTDIAAVARAVAEDNRQAIEDKGLEYEVNIKQIPRALSNSRHIQYLLKNLLSNARKFTDKGKISVDVYYETVRQGHVNIFLKVTDTGRGIATADIERLFVPFSKLENTRGTYANNHGTGLGLTICKQIMDNMGGTIKVESEVGKGSCFTVIFEQVSVG